MKTFKDLKEGSTVIKRFGSNVEIRTIVDISIIYNDLIITLLGDNNHYSCIEIPEPYINNVIYDDMSTKDLTYYSDPKWYINKRYKDLFERKNSLNFEELNNQYQLVKCLEKIIASRYGEDNY